LLGHAKTLTDEQLVAFRNTAFASAPIIMDIGVALILGAYFVDSWSLFKAGFATILVGIFVPMVVAFFPAVVLERHRKGQWYKDDTLSTISLVSKTYPIGFVIAVLLLGLIPVHGELSNAGRLSGSFILAAIMGTTLWIAFYFIMNVLRKSSHEMEKRFDLSFEDAMNVAEDVIRRTGGSVSKIERNPLLGKAIRAEFLTPFGMLRVRRLTPRRTMMEIQKSQDWRALADLLDEAAIKSHPKK